VAIAAIAVVGVGAQWLAARVRVPSVLLLLPAGVLAGPVTGLVDPDELLGEALFPVVAVAVGLILFEGGTSLRLAGSGGLRRSVTGLVTVGVVITMVAGAAGAVALLDLPVGTALVLGAILVVSGPTVVLPLLDAVRLRERLGAVLRWEAIVIDPIGAVIAVATFEAVSEGRSAAGTVQVLLASATVGAVAGLLAAGGLALLLRRHLVPDRLHNPMTLAVVVGTFVAANELSPEAGLFAVTVLGVALANQQMTPIAHIASFGEDLGVLLLGGLFVLLGATVELDAARKVLLPSLALLGVLLVVRWLAVWASTLGAGLTRTERAYLSLIAPRGIVAASVAALFGVRLQAEGVEGGELLAPAAFVVVLGSVAFVSAVARPASQWLHVAEAAPRGVLLAGDAPWLVDAAAVLADHDVPVMVVHLHDDGERAVDRGVPTFQGAIEDDELAEAIHGLGLAKAVVATDTEGADSFLVDRLSDILGRRQVYRVERSHRADRASRSRAWGRRAFPHLTLGARDHAGEDGEGIDPDDPRLRWDIVAVADAAEHPGAVPLFRLRDDRSPVVAHDGAPEAEGPGTHVVAVPRPSTS
ncbi:MAG TPA: cation:proton antiporter, partial [Aquihabitans sp.]|nr:cation:proton antiporter [Aquihabitans sp.]